MKKMMMMSGTMTGKVMIMFKLEIEPSETLHTVFGNAKINKQGYYIITSRKEGNHGKLLHRLIWERWYGETYSDVHIHHIDFNRLNNCLWNLKPMVRTKHQKLHRKYENQRRCEII